MAEMPRGGKERVLHPPTHEGSEPDFAYAYDFEDYLGQVSAEAADLSNFVTALTSGEAARLPLRIEAIGAFRGRTEIDCADRDDFFDEPRPRGAYFFEQDPPAYVKLPFREKPGVVRPDPESLEAYYRIWRGMRGSVEIGQTDNPHQGPNLTLWGGVIELKSSVVLSPSSQLLVDAARGYVSPEIEKKIHLSAKLDEENSSEGDLTLSTLSPILIERIYDPEPRWLDRPYDRYRS